MEAHETAFSNDDHQAVRGTYDRLPASQPQFESPEFIHCPITARAFHRPANQ
jgi:hypothetical protein